VGGRVRIGPWLSGAQTGTIKGADDLLYVLIDKEREPRRFHPANCFE
jgi:hypothetical protein